MLILYPVVLFGKAVELFFETASESEIPRLFYSCGIIFKAIELGYANSIRDSMKTWNIIRKCDSKLSASFFFLLLNC